MTADTDICNRALTAAGAKGEIADLALERSNEAKYCRLFYRSTLNALLGAAHWNFARRVGYLSLLKALPGTPENPGPGSGPWKQGVYPDPPWLYSYAYPQDAAQMRFILPQIQPTDTSGIPIQAVPTPIAPLAVPARPQRFLSSSDTNKDGVRIRNVLTNQPQAIGVYTGLEDNVDMWDARFAQAMECALAYRLAYPLTGKTGLKKDLRDEAQSILRDAQVSDGNEGLTYGPDSGGRLPDWLAVRGTGTDWPFGGPGYYLQAFQNPGFFG